MNNRRIERPTPTTDSALIFELHNETPIENLKEFFIDLINKSLQNVMSPISGDSVYSVQRTNNKSKYKISFTEKDTAIFILKNKTSFSGSQSLTENIYIQPALKPQEAKTQYNLLRQSKTLRKQSQQHEYNFKVFPNGHSLKILRQNG